MATLWMRPRSLCSHLVVRMEEAVTKSVRGHGGRRSGVRVDRGQRLLLCLSPNVLLHFIQTHQVEEQREEEARGRIQRR